MNWTTDTEVVCENIRVNAIIMSEYHKNRYDYLKSRLKFVKIPLIVFNSLNIFFSVGLVEFLPQNYISLLTMGISMVCSIINSIELFMEIEKTMSRELVVSKEFYILSTDIYRCLALDRNNRSIDGKTFLDDSYNRYIKLYEQSNLMNKKIKDSLRPLLQDNVSDKSSDISNENKV
jgi:hypothetical protein